MYLPRRRSAAHSGVLVPIVIALSLGCATRTLPPAEYATTLTEQTLKHTRSMYLHSERIDRRMIVGALDALELRFDSVRFADEEDRGVLRVGKAEAAIAIDDEVDVGRFRTTLGRALYFVNANLDEDLDSW